MSIWKFPLDMSGMVTIPRGAHPLCVQVQGTTPCLWAMVDPSAPKEHRRFIVVGTGHDLPMLTGAYIGTFQLVYLGLVFHVFDQLKAEGGAP